MNVLEKPDRPVNLSKRQGRGLKYLSPKSVAQNLDVNRTTAMRWMKSGKLPAFEMLPGQWRCSEEALNRFMRKKEKGGTGTSATLAEVAPTTRSEIAGHTNRATSRGQRSGGH